MKLSTLKCLKLLADPTRLRLILLLQQQALSVVELQEILGMGQSRISTQLLLMKQEGLVTDQRSGKNNIYQSELPAEFVSIVQEAAAELPETAKDLAALRHLDRKRKDRARAYFDQLAGKFGKHYVPGRSWKGLAEALLKVMNYEVVADLGAGEGTLSQLLAQRAKHVIAVDISPKMVEFGTNLAKEHQLPHLEFRLGDIEEVPIATATVDLAILSQALHHAEEPNRALNEAFRILRPGGQLLILDLAKHSFTKAHELYSDRWLGFSEGELAEWMEQAGFQNIETAIVDRESKAPKFQTLVATAQKS
ncbi:MAG: methyltransferase domain-containing protein [Verrucomicrobia bacterium]|jgi:ArsR family transcriptional regulator|nr:MAG: methyltransferase domain-containing protein [Verrucomicrobiota bacterium]